MLSSIVNSIVPDEAVLPCPQSQSQGADDEGYGLGISVVEHSVPSMYHSAVTEAGVSLMTAASSVASLDIYPDSMYSKAVHELTAAAVGRGCRLAWFSRLAVKPNNQGRGEGTFLMDEMVRLCDEQQLVVVNAPNPYRMEDMARLLKFYRAYGFTTPRGLKGLMLRFPKSLSQIINGK